MKFEILPDAEALARRGAEFIAAQARLAVEARGRFLLAVSGGRTPWRMLRLLADERLAWDFVHVFQVDERVAPAGDPERNLTHLVEALGRRIDPACGRLHAMPVEAPDLVEAAAAYAREVERLAGSPPVLDLVHLGLGADGHTASLFPGDRALDGAIADVAVSWSYQGRRRMTMTLPLLDRARARLWLVSGADKAAALARLRAVDRTSAAGRVSPEHALVLADAAAAAQAPI